MFARTHQGELTGLKMRRPLLTLSVLALIFAAVGAALLDPGLMCIVPAIALPFLLLGLDRYPGEETLLRLSARPGGRRRRLAERAGKPRGTALAVPRGGLLIARSLAVRPPPRNVLAAA